MYNKDKLFQIDRDIVIVTEENPFSNVYYNSNRKIGSRIVKKETPYVSFPILEQFPFIRHGFSTRLGGVSKGMFQTLNLSIS